MQNKKDLFKNVLKTLFSYLEEENKKYTELLNKLSGQHFSNFPFILEANEFLISLKNSEEDIYSILKTLFEKMQTYEKQSREYEKTIQAFLSEESYSFGFKPIDDFRYKIVELVDSVVYPEEYDLIDWFVLENDFGSRNLSVYIPLENDEKLEFKISSIDDIIEFLKFKEKQL